MEILSRVRSQNCSHHIPERNSSTSRFAQGSRNANRDDHRAGRFIHHLEQQLAAFGCIHRCSNSDPAMTLRFHHHARRACHVATPLGCRCPRQIRRTTPGVLTKKPIGPSSLLAIADLACPAQMSFCRFCLLQECLGQFSSSMNSVPCSDLEPSRRQSFSESSRRQRRMPMRQPRWLCCCQARPVLGSSNGCSPPGGETQWPVYSRSPAIHHWRCQAAKSALLDQQLRQRRAHHAEARRRP